MEPTTLIALRAVHVVAGTLWVGAAVMLVAFVAPTVRSLGPDGGRFMQRLIATSRFPEFMGAAGILATVAGLVLLWAISGGFAADWVLSPSGATLVLAALAGIAAFAVGTLVNKPTAARIMALTAEIAAAGAPSAAQAARMAKLQRRLGLGGLWGAILLVVSTLGMASARYVGA
jgi:uncharacterized membrane protein